MPEPITEPVIIATVVNRPNVGMSDVEGLEDNCEADDTEDSDEGRMNTKG